MSLMTSLMYAAAFVALLAVVLECCCRRRLKRLRDSHHIIAMHMVDNTPYPLVTPYPTLPEVSTGGSDLYPMPMPAEANQTDHNVFFNSYPTPSAPKTNVVETPPPSYEQVMANERHVTPRAPRPG